MIWEKTGHRTGAVVLTRKFSRSRLWLVAHHEAADRGLARRPMATGMLRKNACGTQVKAAFLQGQARR